MEDDARAQGVSCSHMISFAPSSATSTYISCHFDYVPRSRPRLPDVWLPTNDPWQDEVDILSNRNQATEVVPQRISFTSLPAEVRNQIYELALPSKEDNLIVATPFQDDLMSVGTQPALTQASKQIRSETLEMFYSNTNFVAYIQNFNFTQLVRWAKCITSTSSPPQVTVHVKLQSLIRCAYQLTDLVRGWRDVNSDTIHLKIHNDCLRSLGPFYRIPSFDQRELVVRAIRAAEELRKRGDASESELTTVCYETFEKVDRGSLGGHAAAVSQSCVWEGTGFYHRRIVD